MKINSDHKPDFLFEKVNYKVLLAGIGVILLGFILMSGGGSDNPNIWNDDIFSFRRIRLAPTVVLIGFGITIYSIFKRMRSKESIGDGNPLIYALKRKHGFKINRKELMLIGKKKS